MTRGWWNMACWKPCPNGAAVCIETQIDNAPGGRFYCLPCAITYLQGLPSE